MSTSVRSMFLLCVLVMPPACVFGSADGCARQFSGQRIVNNREGGVRAVATTDLDGDGDVDLVSNLAGAVAWFENLDGNGTFGQRQLIAEIIDVWGLHTADMDGDGDSDVVVASWNGHRIVWYENLDGHGRFGPELPVSTDVVRPKAAVTADFDGDGDLDVVSASGTYGLIAWHENLDGSGTFGPVREISSDVGGPTAVYACDLDGDGDFDVLSASQDDKVAWYENVDGHGNFGSQRLISTEVQDAEDVLAVDVDDDGDLDVVAAGGLTGLYWFENTDGHGSFGPARLVHELAHAPISAADFDGDGAVDIVAGRSKDLVVWLRNSDGLGTFGQAQLITSTANVMRDVTTADLDSDGDIDVISGSLSDDRIAWYENETDCNGNGINDGCDLADLTSNDCNYNGRPDECDIDDALSSDCNGDGVPDECQLDCNKDGVADDCELASGTVMDCDVDGVPDHCEFGSDFVDWVITVFPADLSVGSFNVPGRVAGADVDADGDVDVLATLHDISQIAWYENLDGLGTFGQHRFVTPNGTPAQLVGVADLDGDGDIDVLSHTNLRRLEWYENLDGAGTFGNPHIIDPNAVLSIFVAVGDVDSDDDLDVVVSNYFQHRVDWFENTDGAGTFGPAQRIISPTGYSQALAVHDVDGDGDLDVITADQRVVWVENLDGHGNFGSPRVVVDSTYDQIALADLDGDGDADVAATSYREDELVWFANTDSHGTFGPARLISTDARTTTDLRAVDLDGDGDNDILLATGDSAHFGGSHHVAWYENLDARGMFGSMRLISTAAMATMSIDPVDIDGDGDVDVVSTSQFDDTLMWHENLGHAKDCNGNLQLDVCEDDADRDYVIDDCDSCPNTLAPDAILIAQCDPHIVDYVRDDGCTVRDELAACDGLRSRDSAYRECVRRAAKAMWQEDFITGREYARIQFCLESERATKQSNAQNRASKTTRAAISSPHDNHTHSGGQPPIGLQ